MNIIYDIEQGSDDWLMLRLGKLTASKFADVISKGRGKEPSKTRVSYMYQLAAEILVGEPTTFFKNAAMQWGTDCEPAARAAYEIKHDLDVVECAFIEHDEWVGVSPDGLVGIDGLLEIKAPNTTTHLKYYMAGTMPEEYLAQVQGQLWVSGRDWCDFVSYDPRVRSEADYFELRVNRDDEYIKNLEVQCSTFIDELKELLTKLGA
tara:strand:- start:327 stop:944 length:618 start_codon:yes stop_codon:yes gene_type:complete